MKIFNHLGFLTTKGAQNMAENISSNIESSKFITEFISKLKNVADSKEAMELLEQSAKNGDFVIQNGVLFKHDEYTIQCMLNLYADNYAQNMKKISDMNLQSAPRHIGTLKKDGITFIVSKLVGCKSGELIPYARAQHLVSKDDKMIAFKDIQKAIKAGLIDNNIANGALWFVAPDSNKIMFPSWEALRPVQPGEGQKILNDIHNRLFNS